MEQHGHETVSAIQPGTASLVAHHPKLTIGILTLALSGWLLLVWLVIDMSHPLAQLTMPASPQWSAANLLAVWIMWSVMMIAMMLPSALPMILTFVRLSVRGGEPARARGFVTAYLSVWFGFSAVATAAQWLFQHLDWTDPMIVSRSPILTGMLLLIAGVYQFSPLKRTCLSRCSTPMGFLLGEWRPGTRGAFVMGLRHGIFCLGCCWALMALLFVGGVMNLAWIAALAIAVAVEKLLPGGERVAATLGLLLIGIAGIKLLALYV